MDEVEQEVSEPAQHAADIGKDDGKPAAEPSVKVGAENPIPPVVLTPSDEPETTL